MQQKEPLQTKKCRGSLQSLHTPLLSKNNATDVIKLSAMLYIHQPIVCFSMAYFRLFPCVG
jgi:hypothetical protein